MDERTEYQRYRKTMQKLSTTFHIELTELRLHTYWEALQDFPIDAVEWAAAQAVKEEPHFPVPLTLRQYAKHCREAKLQRVEQEAARLLPQWSDTPDEVGVQAIRDILHLLGDHMAMTHPIYQAPTEEAPEVRKARLVEQARQTMNGTGLRLPVPTDKETPHGTS